MMSLKEKPGSYNENIVVELVDHPNTDNKVDNKKSFVESEEDFGFVNSALKYNTSRTMVNT